MSTLEEIDCINIEYTNLMKIKNLMLKQEKRYKELKILIKYCDTKDLKDYKEELRYNIASHHDRYFRFHNYSHSDGDWEMKIFEELKKHANDHPYLKHPDLEFSLKIKKDV